MDPNRFGDTDAGQLVRGQFNGQDYWAFAPNSLPPKLTLDIELIKALSDADRSLGELSGLGRSLVNPHVLVQPFIRREAVMSSRIEGTQTGIAGLYAYEAGQPIVPQLEHVSSEADAREVLNYVRALEYGLSRVSTLPISLRLIRELHGILMDGVRGGNANPGEFRRVQNWIGVRGSSISDAAFVPPPPDTMVQALHALEGYLHTGTEYPPLIRIALIHYQFESIHPFADGNGRVGRLLVSLLLSCWNLLSLPLLYLSDYFERNRREYYDLLRAVSERGSWRDWIVFFLHGVAEQCGDATHRAKGLLDLQIDYRRRLQSKGAPGKALMTVDSLFDNPVTTIPHIQKVLQVTHRTASRIVGELVEEGVLSPVGDRLRNRQFAATEILSIVSGDSDM
jgi:Fic family protein